jgi:hypothetical protein
MSADDRLIKLRALIDRLERLPTSAESEWMLREARARMVDVETGEMPSGMRPLAEPPPPPQEPRRPAPRQPQRIEPEPPVSEPSTGRVDEKSATADASDASFGTEGVLSLEDSSSDGPDGNGGGAGTRPWRRGLRG